MSGLTLYEKEMPHKHMRQYADNALASLRLFDETKDDAYLEQALSWKDKFNAVADHVDNTVR